MANCLLSLGSNVGDRAATLSAAIDEVTALPDVQVVRQSNWLPSQPVGGPSGQSEFLNGAALIETSVPPLTLLDELKRIEARRGRQTGERWAARTLDIDVLLYDDAVIETEMLTLPHPRMSFRRFVLTPAVVVAPKMLHPIIGWPIERLLLHLNMASDRVAIVSPSAELRDRASDCVAKQPGWQPTDAPKFATAEHHWPTGWTSWLVTSVGTSSAKASTSRSQSLPYAAAEFPKLTVLLDDALAKPGDKLLWSTLVRQPGRGPTLRVPASESDRLAEEILAAIRAVWPI